MEFKEYCLLNYKNLPDQDEETLRSLYVNQFKIEDTYIALTNKIKIKKQLFPIKFTNNMMKILTSGGVYIHGRDKCFRPIVVLNIENMNT